MSAPASQILMLFLTAADSAVVGFASSAIVQANLAPTNELLGVASSVKNRQVASGGKGNLVRRELCAETKVCLKLRLFLIIMRLCFMPS